jgi:hypothetical protein
VTIADTTGQAVGFEWKFTDSTGECVGADPDDPLSCDNVGTACRSIVVGVSPGTAGLTILVDGVAYGALDCLVLGPGDSAGFGTNGTVTRTRL